MKYKIKYRHQEDNIGNTISNKFVKMPVEIQWIFGGCTYLLESKLEFKSILSENEGTKIIVSNSIYDFITSAYLGDKYAIVLYSIDLQFNKVHPKPNNLILYNLKKEITKIIPPPNPINWKGNPAIFSIGDVEILESREYISVYISEGYFAENVVEKRYLDLETLEYHPTENIFVKNYGR